MSEYEIVVEANPPSNGPICTVKCSCGHILGQFYNGDDHSDVVMRCPKCGGECEISNSQLSNALDRG